MKSMEIVIVVLTAGILIVRMLPARWLALLLPPRGPGPSTGEVCVACDARNVTLLAPMVYRCNVCGHEGGDGWAARERARRDAAYHAWSPARRRKSAKRDLLEARTLIIAGLGDIERAKSEPAGSSEGAEALLSERDRSKASGTGLLLEAQGKARDAQAKLDVSLGAAADARLDEADSCEELLVRGRAMLRAIEAVRRSASGRSRDRSRTRTSEDA